MPKMSDVEVSALLQAERLAALAATQASTLSEERERATRYYMGDMTRDMPSMDGRSTAVSSDVLDTIEGLMPALMEIFAGNEEVVKFDPVGPDDVDAAEQETDYVNHVFMQKNAGFLVLYSFIKDALMSKVGVVKVWTEEEEREEKETYVDQPEDAFGLIASNPEYEIVAHSEHDGLHDVTIVCNRKYKCHKVCAVPPEEFGISRDARCIADAGYVFHETTNKTEADLIDEGYDGDQVRRLPTYSLVAAQSNAESQARDSVHESDSSGGDEEGANTANRPIKVTQHYVNMDYEDNGKPQLYLVTTAGDSEVLLKNGEAEILPINRIPMAAMTPVIVTHRFFGRSVADLVMDIQRQKTALLRAMLDNIYMSSNPRPIVAESGSSETTLDDLLISRPGMPIRAKTADAVVWSEVPFIGANILPIMQFLDSLKENRTGVSRAGQGTDPNVLQNQVATIANQMFTAAQAKTKLIARIFAETGIKDLFSLLHAEIRENGDQPQIVRLRGQWVTVDPTDWKERNDMTINVGLGTGSNEQELAKLQLLIGAQEKAIQVGMVSPNNLHNSAKDLVRLVGRKDPDSYFTPPGKPGNPQDPASAPIPPPPSPDAMKNQATQQANAQKAQLEQQKAQTDAIHQQAKAQSDIAVAERKAQLDEQIKLLEARIAQQKHEMDMQVQAAKFQAAQAAKPPAATVEVKHGADQLTGPMGDIVKELTQHITDTLGKHQEMHNHNTQAVLTALAQHSAPKRIRKTGNGEYVTETVTH